MITRKEILNPHSTQYDTHIHKHNRFMYIKYRCNHTVYEMIPYCTLDSFALRTERLSKLLCETCEEEQLQWLKEEYDM